MSNLVSIHSLTLDLYNRWRTLLGEMISSNLDNLSEEELNRMKDIHNKLALTILTQERYLLAVTGLQGAGKTTFVRRLYNLDATYLQDNDGRGEKLPILITESDISEPVGYVMKSNYSKEQEFTIHSEVVSPEEFDRIAKAPRNEEIWVELKVPFQHFHDEKKSLILLPGFEKDTEELSQKLLEHVLYLSTSSIVVFRKDTFARANNVEMLERVKEIYGKVKPIYVLTHGDINVEENESIIAQFMELLQLNSDENDRVIMSGDPTKFQSDWKVEVLNKISKYGFLTKDSEEKKIALFSKLFGDVRNEINRLDDYFRKEEEKAILSEYHSDERNTSKLLEQFDNLCDRVLNDLENEVRLSLENRKVPAKEEFDKYVKENESVWKNFVQKFSAKALENEQKAKKAVQDAWLDATKSKPEVDIINATTKYIEENANLLKAPGEIEQISTKSRKANRFSLLELETTEEEQIQSTEQVIEVIDTPKVISAKEVKSMTSIDRINLFFDRDYEKADIVTLNRDDLKVLTIIGTMLCRESLYENQLWVQNEGKLGTRDNLKFEHINELKQDTLVKTLDGISGFSAEMSQFTPLLLKSVPGILGVDMVLDGEADLINHVAGALSGIGINVSSLQLLGAIGIGVSLVYGVNAVQQAVDSANQRQLALSRAGNLAINELPEIQTKAYIQSLRRVFDRMSDQLREVHKERLGDYDNDTKIESLRYSLQRIKTINSQLQQMVYEHAPLII